MSQLNVSPERAFLAALVSRADTLRLEDYNSGANKSRWDAVVRLSRGLVAAIEDAEQKPPVFFPAEIWAAATVIWSRSGDHGLVDRPPFDELDQHEQDRLCLIAEQALIAAADSFGPPIANDSNDTPLLRAQREQRAIELKLKANGPHTSRLRRWVWRCFGRANEPIAVLEAGADASR